MKLIHWLFVLSMLFFVSSVGLVIASARMAQRAPSGSAQVASMHPVASVKQIMVRIVDPAATAVYESVGTTISTSGTETWAPETPAEWDAVGDSAALLIESANLMMMGSRVVDTGDWITMSRAMLDGAQLALKAVESRNADALFASGEPINASCDSCHGRYKRQ